MYTSVQDALRLISGKLDAALVPETTYLRLLAFAARYPELGQAQYLECRLGATERAQVDLLVSAATTFERRTFRAALAARPDDRAGLPPLRRLVERWIAPDSVLHDRVPLAWLEFDHMEREVDPIGNVGVCLAPAYIDPFAALPEQAPDEVLPVILESIHAVSAQPVAAEDRRLLQTCVEGLPRGARWIHLSIMVARDPLQLKLYGAFPCAAVLPYLARVGCAADPAPIARVLERSCPSTRTGDSIYLDLPVTGMLDPRQAGLGLAFGQQHLRISHEQDPSRRALLESLTEDGLCTPAQRDALVAWPGHETGVEAARAVNGEGAIDVQRWLDIKLVCAASGALQAKAYLGFAARRAPAVGLNRAVGARPAREASPILPQPPRTI
jgi:hypothetical protein